MSQLNELISDVVATPLGDVIAAVGRGVADAQAALDEGSLAQTLALYSEGGDAALQLLRDIGYQPTFYTLPETTGTVKVALKLAGSVEQTAQAPLQVNPLATLAQSTVATSVNTSAIANTAAATQQNPRDAIIAARKLSLDNPSSSAAQFTNAQQKSASTNTSSASTLNAFQEAINASRRGRAKLYATPVDASYANRFSFNADVSATLSFKIVPVPPPAGVDELRVLPNLIGDNLNRAQERLAALNIDAQIKVRAADGSETEWDESENTNGYEVVAQQPDNIQIIRADRLVTLYVSAN